jgi:protein-L-isoaspartate(D-aspartate) O-methyltransferase
MTHDPSQHSAQPRPKASLLALLSVFLIAAVGIALVFKLDDGPHDASGDEPVPAAAPDERQDSEYNRQRQRMVETQLAARDIRDPRVLAAMGKVPRHLFVPSVLQSSAYADRPLPIDHDQTISQPYIVALMTQLAQAEPEDRALEVGTGSGYQAAVLAETCKEVYSIEIVEPLADSARGRLQALGYKSIEVRHGDGYRGWPEKAPFDVIIVAAAPDHVPEPLIEQLAPRGRLVIPVGNYWQSLMVLEKDAGGNVHQREVTDVAFVPMTGEAERDE